MLGFFASYLITMLDDTKTTETVFTKLIKNKVESGLGSFMFGFRIVDTHGQSFWEYDTINWKVVTTRYTWDGTQYDQKNTTYSMKECQNYYEEDLKDVIDLAGTNYERADLNSYKCPETLLPDFIGGT